MAFMPSAKTEEEVKAMSMSVLKKAYNSLAEVYNRILNNKLIYCHKCNEHLSADTFYMDENYASGKFPICKKCLLAMVEQRVKKNDEPNETKESVQRVLMMMDLPYDDKFYMSCVKGAEDGMKEKNRKSPFTTYITCMKSLPNWKGKTWKDSDFVDNEVIELSSNIKPRKDIIKTFGSGFTNDDYLYLQDQYDDWKSRVQVGSKSQETYIIQICFKQLEIWKAQKSGKDTDKLVKSLNDLMNGANLMPRQNVGNAATDSLTFGQLIEKWELNEPIPEPQEEFADPDNIGKFLRVWFKGSLMRALGLDGGYAQEYDDYIEQYTVKKPTNIDGDDSVDESMYEKVFGKED